MMYLLHSKTRHSYHRIKMALQNVE